MTHFVYFIPPKRTVPRWHDERCLRYHLEKYITEVIMLYAGVDTHKKYSRVVVTNNSGQLIALASLANDITSFKDFFLKMTEPVKTVVEAGRTWGIIYDMLEDLGTDPVLANPLKARAIAEAKIKTDSIDARTLTDLLRLTLFRWYMYPPGK
jgi:transposase